MSNRARNSVRRAVVVARWLLRAVASVFLGLAAICVILIVVLLTYSSVRRYILGTPIAETEELSALLFMAMAFLAIVPGFVRGRQIRLTLLNARLPARSRGIARLVGDAVSLVALAVIVRECWAFADFSLQIGSRSEIAGILLWPWMFIVPVSLIVLATAIVVDALDRLSEPAQGRTTARDAPPSTP